MVPSKSIKKGTPSLIDLDVLDSTNYVKVDKAIIQKFLILSLLDSINIQTKTDEEDINKSKDKDFAAGLTVARDIKVWISNPGP